MLDFDRVEAKGLSKTYGVTRALIGVDAVFARGESWIVEGPNGAGKSTLLSLLSLLARPTRGSLRFGDHDAVRHGAELRGRIGVLAHAAMIYPDLTGLESLALTASLYELLDPRGRVAAMRDRFELGTFAERPARTYSRGQLQRLALARALLPAPRLVLLDEPSTGLDARSTDRLAGAVEEERARGAIVAVVTHDEAFAARVATHRLRIERGRVVRPSAEGEAAP